MGGPTPNTARNDEIARLFAAGETSGVIATMLGISRSAVMGTVNRLRQAGDPRIPEARGRPAARRARKSSFADRLADRLAELVANGSTIAGAAWKLDLTTARAEALWADICRGLGPQAC